MSSCTQSQTLNDTVSSDFFQRYARTVYAKNESVGNDETHRDFRISAQILSLTNMSHTLIPESFSEYIESHHRRNHCAMNCADAARSPSAPSSHFSHSLLESPKSSRAIDALMS